MKKSKKILIFILVAIIIVVLGYFAYTNENEKEVKVIKKINKYGYNLKENETELYKDEFDRLNDILTKDEVDYDEYAKSVAKLFIIDFYTLSNKLSKNDIGGTEFIKDDMKDNFIEEARSTFYKYLQVKTDERNQELPEVSSIDDVTLEKTEFKYADKTVDNNAYKVTISWSYKQDLGYESNANMIIVKQDKKLYVVEMD